MDQNQPPASSNGSGVPEPVMHKNHLITYTQRLALTLPVYETVNLGYTCTVHVDGVGYASVNTFRNPKDAEQDASKMALESIAKKIKEESIAIIDQDTVSCKSILNEYAVKMNLPIPTYTTTQPELLPIFTSSLVFDGKTYTGPAARSKKDAERLASRMAIHSIIGTSGSGTCLPEIIISKSRLSNTPRILEESQTVQDSNTAMVEIPGSNCVGSTRKRKQILNPCPQTLGEDVTAVPPPSHDYKKPRDEISCEINVGPIGDVACLLDQSANWCSDRSVIEHCIDVSEAPCVVQESQTIQATNMAIVASPGSNCEGSRMMRKEILDSSPSQTLVGVVTETPPPSNIEIGNTATLLDQPVDGCSDKSDTISYKSVLNEYAVKMHHPLVTYTTRQQDHHSFFISSFVFNGKTYTGPAARNKKEAERLAARMVIHSITGTSDEGTCLSEIIKSKSRMSNAPRKAEESQSMKGTSMVMVASNRGSPTRVMKNILSSSSSQALVEDVTTNPPPSHEIKKLKEEPLFETNAGPIGNLSALLNQPVGGC